MFERILVSVDGSDTSNQALHTAVRMASAWAGQSRLRLVHVLDEALSLGGYVQFGRDLSDMQATLDLGRSTGTRVLNDALRIARAAGVQADTELLDRYSHTLGTLVASAAVRWHADLMVVGTHGRQGVGRALLGSGAEEILRTAPVPVLVVRLQL